MSIDGAIDSTGRSRTHQRLVAGGLAVALTTVGALLGGLLGVVALLVVVGSTRSGGAAVVALTAAAEIGYLAVGLGYLVVLSDGVPLSRPSGRQLAAGVLASVALASIGQGVLRLVPGAGIDDVSGALARAGLDPIVFLTLAVVAVVLVGPAEELLFRGAVQGTLRRVFGPWAAIGGASVLFTAVHIPLFNDTPLGGLVVALGVVFLVSVALGYTFEQTGSLVVPAVMHSLYDGLLLVGAYLIATGAFG